MSEAEQTLPNPNMEGPPADSGREVRIDPESLAKHYETDDVRPRPIIWFTIGTLIMTMLAVLVMWWFMSRWAAEPFDVQVQIPPADVIPPSVPGPGLQAAPEVDMDLLLLRESARLSGYGWIDRDNGIVQIPIEAAMELIVEASTSTTGGEVPDFGLDPAHQLDSTGGWGILIEGLENVEVEVIDSETTDEDALDFESVDVPDAGTVEGETDSGGVIDSEATDANSLELETEGGVPDAGVLDSDTGDAEVIDSEMTDENAPEFESPGGAIDGSSGSEVTGDE